MYAMASIKVCAAQLAVAFDQSKKGVHFVRHCDGRCRCTSTLAELQEESLGVAHVELLGEHGCLEAQLDVGVPCTFVTDLVTDLFNKTRWLVTRLVTHPRYTPQINKPGL